MTDTFKKSSLLLLFCLVATTMCAAVEDTFYNLTDFTKSGDSYELALSSEQKANKQIIHVEMPAADASGTVGFKCKSAKADRHLYIHKDAGETQDTSRGMEMSKDYKDVAFTASDIAAKNGKYWLVFSTSDDFKYTGIHFTTSASSGGQGGDDPVPGGGDDPTPGGGDEPTPSNQAKYVPLGLNNITANTTVFASDITVAGDPATDWVVVPSYGTKSLKYTNTNNDANGNPEGITDNLETTDGNVNMIQIKADGNTYESAKRVVIMHVKGITGIIAHGATSSSGRGMAIGCDEFASAPAKPTEVANVTRKGNSGSFLVAENGLDASKEYIVSFYAVSGDACFYAVEFITDGGTAPSDPVSVESVALDKTAIELEEGKTTQLKATVTPANATDKTLVWSSSDPSVADVNSAGLVSAKKEGKATVTVTTKDGAKTATCDVTVTAKSGGDDDPAVPQTNLALHEPEIYENAAGGGYGGTLSVFGGREYEVYYVCRDASGNNISIATAPADKVNGITTGTEKTVEANDGWFKLNSSNGKGGDSNAAAKDEFAEKSVQCIKMQNGHEFTFHVQGFDQFSFYGKDNNKDASKERYFMVYIDDIKQNTAPVDGYAIHRYDMTPGEHVIKLTACGTSDSKLTGFSLRVSDQPRTKYVKGDTAQVVLQTEPLKPVYFYTKYASKGETKLIWNSAKAENITLAEYRSDALGDTLVLSGVADCPVGEYSYYVAALVNGYETSRTLPAKFNVIRKVQFLKAADSVRTVYEETNIEPVVIRYYSNDDEALSWEWTGGNKPADSDFTFLQNKEANTVTISGKPLTAGSFTYQINLTGAEPVRGTINVRSNKPTVVPGADKTMLYLSKTDEQPSDELFDFLKTRYNYFTRSAAGGLSNADYYKQYDFILISESVDADNEEVLAVIRGDADKPVLNLKGFTYAPGRVTPEGWGKPDNGTVDTVSQHGRYIFIQREDHPVFKSAFGSKKQGDSIQLFSDTNGKSIMPVDVKLAGTLCLATAYTRNKNNYWLDGELQTAIHEIPATTRGRKYICFPIAQAACRYLTQDGKKLLGAVIDYLLSDEATVALPELQINSFAISGVQGDIDQANSTINIAFDLAQYPDLNLEKVVPVISVASPLTHVVPLAGDTVDFSTSTFHAVEYEVTDYINRRVYEVTVSTYNSQGIEQIYTAGEWVNIYDIYGRKIAATNEDIYSMTLPQGVYLVVTESGNTLKLLR